MKIKLISLLVIFAMVSMLIAACGQKANTDVKGSETTKNSGLSDASASAISGAPDMNSVDDLNKELDSSDIDNINVNIDENTFK